MQNLIQVKHQEKSPKNEIGENKINNIDICDICYVFLSKQ